MPRSPSNCHRMVEVAGVRAEAPNLKTLLFRDALCAKAQPGQFVMVWVPGVGESPMSISIMGPDDQAGITVAKVGATSGALCGMRKGGLIGVRGPYGRPFEPIQGRALVVGGGVGMAPLATLVEKLVEKGAAVTLVMGAEGRSGLVFLRRMQRVLDKPGCELVATTEDGSYGVRGTAPDAVEGLLRVRSPDAIYVCGREAMMWKVFRLAEEVGVPLQASLERRMRCAIGICGQCTLDPLGLRVCRDGPVFNSEVLRKLRDFGRYQRDATGRRIPVL